MLYEYAVEPKAIGASWESFRYLIEKFGFHRGRLISQFPGKWIQLVVEAAKQSGMQDVRYKSLVNRLQKAKREALIRSGREYDPHAGDWLDNAIEQHTLDPFHAIIASENWGDNDFILVAEDIVEETPLMNTRTDWGVERTSEAIAEAMSPLLKFSKKILFLDPYLDIREQRYRETLKASLEIVAAHQPGNFQCEIHFCTHDSRPSTEFIIDNAADWLSGILPESLSILLFCWAVKADGDIFHDRYLVTDRGGMSLGAGLSSESAHQKVHLYLLEHETCQEKLAAFERNSTVYKLAEHILEISSDGKVRRL